MKTSCTYIYTQYIHIHVHTHIYTHTHIHIHDQCQRCQTSCPQSAYQNCKVGGIYCIEWYVVVLLCLLQAYAHTAYIHYTHTHLHPINTPSQTYLPRGSNRFPNAEWSRRCSACAARSLYNRFLRARSIRRRCSSGTIIYVVCVSVWVCVCECESVHVCGCGCDRCTLASHKVCIIIPVKHTLGYTTACLLFNQHITSHTHLVC